jgi:hypothetical protein
MTDSPRTPVCLECGATDDQQALECWYCRRRNRRRSSSSPIASSNGRRARGPLSTIRGWMVLIALIAVAAAISRTAPMPVLLMMTIVFVPSVMITEIRANRRQRRGLPMSGWERTVSVIQAMVAFSVLLLFGFTIAACIALSFVAR